MPLFPTSRPAPPRFGCFGKLPSYADFLSLNADGPEVQALTAWLQSGIVSAPEVAGANTEQILHYVWRPDGGRRTLVGVLWQSTDSAGRRFPFTMFAAIPSPTVAAHGPRRLLAAESIRRRIYEIFTQVVRSPRIRDQYVMIDSAPVPPVPEPAEAGRVFRERSEAAVLRREDAPAFAGHVVEVARFADRIRAAAELPDFALRIELLGPDQDVETAAWTQVLCDRLGVQDIDATYFLRFARHGPAAFVFHRALEPHDLPYLLAPYDDSKYVESVGVHPAGGGATQTRLAESLRRTWDAHAPSYAGLIDVASGAGTADPSAADTVPPPEGAATLPESNRLGEEVRRAVAQSAAARQPAPATGPVTARAPAPKTMSVAPASPRPPAPPAAPPTAPTPAPTTAEPPPAEAEAPPPAAPSLPAGTPATRETAPAAPETGAPSRAEEPVTGETRTAEGVAAPPANDIARQIEALAAGPLLPGRLVRAGSAAASAADTAETAGGGHDVLLYLEDGGYATMLQGLDAGAVDEIERQVAACGEARRLLGELAAEHRRTEERLRQAIDDACGRARRPGAAH